MECAGKGLGTRCTGPPTGRCARCGAVVYCSVSHQTWSMSKWSTWLNNSWDLSNIFCPFTEPSVTISECLTGWKEYCERRSIPLHSPVALLLHWSLLGPSIPQHRWIGWRDGRVIQLCTLPRDCICKSSSETVSGDVHTSEPSAVTLHLRSGFYHDRYMDITKDSSPSVIAPNAGIAAYSSWSSTIELIKDMNIPAVFSNYCQEACHLGARCISSVTGHPLNIPIQLNPFRQPMAVEDSVLVLPCYSNCFLYGMSNWPA